MIQIQSTANVASNGIKTLVYGSSGAGKTTLCATAPQPIILSAESGLLSLARYRLPYIEIKTSVQLTEAYMWALQSAEARQFYTVCLDSLSEIIEVVLADELKKTKDPRKAYGEILTQGVAIARTFRDLPGKCVVIVTKEEYSKDESTGVMMYGPMLPGSKLGQQLPYFFDETFRMEVFQAQNGQPSRRALRTARSFQHVAKDRSGVLNEFEEPNLTNIFRKILSI